MTGRGKMTGIDSEAPSAAGVGRRGAQVLGEGEEEEEDC